MRLLLLLAALAAVPSAALAIPITIEVTGTASVYETFDNSETGVDRLATLPHLTMTATITFDVNRGPAPELADFSGGQLLQASVGPPLLEWVAGSLTWAGGTFVVTPFISPPGAVEVGDILILQNHVGSPDIFTLVDGFVWQDPIALNIQASRLLFVFDDHFIDDAGPPAGNELPNVATAIGRVGIQSFTIAPGGELATGYQAVFDVTSASLRQVPEPGTLSLLLVAATMLAVGRRKRMR